MTPSDLKILCTALGFTAVVMQDGKLSKKEGALRATEFAGLIEKFCCVSLPGAFGIANESLGDDSGTTEIDRAIEKFKAELKGKQDARLPEDRQSLIRFYARLQQRQAQRNQNHFFARATEDVIANYVLQMIDEELEHDGATA